MTWTQKKKQYKLRLRFIYLYSAVKTDKSYLQRLKNIHSHISAHLTVQKCAILICTVGEACSQKYKKLGSSGGGGGKNPVRVVVTILLHHGEGTCQFLIYPEERRVFKKRLLASRGFLPEPYGFEMSFYKIHTVSKLVKIWSMTEEVFD